MISVIITSFKEPKSTLKAVKAVLGQKGLSAKEKKELKIIVVDPFPETEEFLKENLKSDKVEFFLDPGEGKSYALNLLFQERDSGNKEDIWVLTDGDVYISDRAIREIADKFKDEKIGCVTARGVNLDGRKTKYGFWAELAFLGINKVRKRLSSEKKFFECSGYLFAVRQGVLFDFPTGTSEDSIIPWLFWKKGYRVAYADKAEVYVKNPENWKDYSLQKVRNIKAHENLNTIAPDMKKVRTKSLFNEVKEGGLFVLSQVRSFREFIWALQLYVARLWIYILAFRDLRAKKKYQDGWRGEGLTESTSLEGKS